MGIDLADVMIFAVRSSALGSVSGETVDVADVDAECEASEVRGVPDDKGDVR